MVRVVRLERTVSWSQTRRDTNFAIPGYSIAAIISRREGKSKIFLSVVIPVVKAAFVPFSATGGNPAIARAARLCGLLSKPRMDRVYALPNVARYQLRYTRVLKNTPPASGRRIYYTSFLGFWQGEILPLLTDPERPSKHRPGLSFPRHRPSPRAPCGQRPPACGTWAGEDPAPG